MGFVPFDDDSVNEYNFSSGNGKGKSPDDLSNRSTYLSDDDLFSDFEPKNYTPRNNAVHSNSVPLNNIENNSRSDVNKPTIKKSENSEKSEKNKKAKKRKPIKISKKGQIILNRVIAVVLVFVFTFLTIFNYVFVNMVKFVNGDVAIDLNEYKSEQSQTTIIYATKSDGENIELARLHGEENRIWVSLDKMPDNLKNAFICLEDKRFYKHSGVDWIRTSAVILKAVVNPSGATQGGSTITQQLIKNLTGENQQTVARKFHEIENALNLEKNFSKDTILETYLNTLYLDSGCYGVETASEYYFGKSVSELNLAECACIAAITKAPRAYNPILNPEANKERQIDCLWYMYQQGAITEKEYEEAKDYELVFTTSDNYVAKDTDNGGSTLASSIVGEDEEIQSYYVDYVIDSVISDLQSAYDYSYSEAWRKVYKGGLKIYSAVDLDVQDVMENIYENRIDFPTALSSYGEEIQSCMTVMDYEGRLLGIVGQAGEKTANRCLNIASDSPRQPGSSIKPLSVYSLAIDSDEYSWSYPLVQNYGILVNGERWPVNYGGDTGSAYSYITLQAALAPSYNTVPAHIVDYFGTEKCYDWLENTFHITTLTDNDKNYSAMAVGGMYYGVTSIELTAAYAVFGNGGKYYEPYSYYKVTNSTGSKVFLAHTSDEGEQVIEESSAYVMNKMLQTVVTSSNGTARNYKVSGFTTFAKTGTTTDNKDYWFVGGTPYYVASVWFGYSEHPEDMTGKVSGKPGGKVFQSVMNAIHEGLDDKEFDEPDDVVCRTYCKNTGLIAGSGCYNTGTGWYKKSNIPSTCNSCSGHSSTTKSNATTASSTTQVLIPVAPADEADNNDVQDEQPADGDAQ